MDKYIALVTGGNRGIGYATCKELVRAGCDVILTCRSEADGLRAVSKFGSNHNIVFRKLDVTDTKNIQRTRDWIEENYGRLDILINNAGIYLDEGLSMFDVDEKVIRETMEVNFYGAFRMCRTFVPLMRLNGYGRIVNVSSGYGAMSEMGGNVAAYRISKAALNALTLIMAHELKELKQSDIKINAVCPSWVSTQMGGSMAPVTAESAAKDIVHFAIVDRSGPSGGFFRYKKRIPW